MEGFVGELKRKLASGKLGPGPLIWIFLLFFSLAFAPGDGGRGLRAWSVVVPWLMLADLG